MSLQYRPEKYNLMQMKCTAEKQISFVDNVVIFFILSDKEVKTKRFLLPLYLLSQCFNRYTYTWRLWKMSQQTHWWKILKFKKSSSSSLSVPCVVVKSLYLISSLHILRLKDRKVYIHMSMSCASRPDRAHPSSI